MRVPIEAVARKPTAFLRFMLDDPLMAQFRAASASYSASRSGQVPRRGLRGRPAKSRSNIAFGKSRISLATTPICHGITR